MIRVVSYTNGLTGLLNDNYSKITIKINDVEFEVPARALLSISEKPKEILQKVTLPSAPSHYEYEGVQITPMEYTQRKNTLLSFRDEIEDGDTTTYTWPEEKLNEYTHLMKFKAVFADPEHIWQPVGFDFIKQEFIEEKYQGFIESTVIIDTAGSIYNTRALCKYTSNAHTMLLDVVTKLGFTLTKNEHEKGKVVYLYSGPVSSLLQFSKVNGNYFKIPEGLRKNFRDKVGTLEECIARFDQEYSVIYNYLKEEAYIIDHPLLGIDERNTLRGMVDTAITILWSMSPKAADKDKNRSLVLKLAQIKKHLTGNGI